MAYAELHCLSNFSFQRGASHAEELVTRAVELGYHALAITDECSLAGIVRAHVAAKAHGLKLLIGSEITLEDGLKLILLAPDLAAYGDLAQLITRGRCTSEKGSYHLGRTDLERYVSRLLCLWPATPNASTNDLRWLQTQFSGRLWLTIALHCHADDFDRLSAIQALARDGQLPLCASGDVHMHDRKRRSLQDVLTAIRLGKPVSQCGRELFPNGERHLRSLKALKRRYPPELLEETIRIADLCTFSLDSICYQYPTEHVPPGASAIQHLRALTETGLHKRYPDGIPAPIRLQIESELSLIEELKYEHYFLTVEDIVSFAHKHKILCQGRGSAANSAVCFALGITEVNPNIGNLLFERFISRERKEPPDIDVDFENGRREEVIQYLYKKYGRERAALTATVITYRRKSAIRDVGRALGFEENLLDRIVAQLGGGDKTSQLLQRLEEAGLDPEARLTKLLLAFVHTLLGFPRHLSQHVGGFVLTQGPISRLVPIENASMPERTVIQWDKDDLDVMHLLKVDVLALGMLTALKRSLALVASIRQKPGFSLSAIPQDCKQVYEMLCKGDSIGVFQVESRAQISMLPRLQPRTFYDLVIEVAIVRPGPIQGGMVHPYLHRRAEARAGRLPNDYQNDDVKAVLERTLGVPIFQEQVMKLAIVAAGFTPGKADDLRRSMAAWKRSGKLQKFKKELIDGMLERHYPQEFAEHLFAQIEGFSEYGFPESHAASFALLVYASAWLKCHEPAAFLCGLLNAQPMGFYSPSQLIQDARRHGVEVLPVDVQFSEWDCTLEKSDQAQPPVRLGLRLVDGLGKNDAEQLIRIRPEQGFSSVDQLARCSHLSRRALEALANADTFRSIAGNRRSAWWHVSGVEHGNDVLSNAICSDPVPELPPLHIAEEVLADYQSTGLTLRPHPLTLLRRRLKTERLLSAAELHSLPDRCPARACGMVVGRQRPGTAKGVVFVTLEDETGNANIIVWPDLAESQRRELLGSRLLAVYGIIQRQGEVVHLLAKRLADKSGWLGSLTIDSRDFH